MPIDLLVKLYELPEPASSLEDLRTSGIHIQRARPFEKTTIVGWVRERWPGGWPDECEASFHHTPVGCFVALQNGSLLGFSCYDATARGMFGPVGVAGAARRQGIGRALTLATLAAMRSDGYAYAIIGAAGPVEFFVRAAGAVPIPGSWPGYYGNPLRSS